MKVAVTGGAGFIGSHLVDRLIEAGYDVLAIDNLSSGVKDHVNNKAVFLEADILRDLSFDLEGIDTVFHLAADPDVRSSASDPGKSFELNVVGTFAVLGSCRKAGVKRFVFASTSTVYGEADVIPTPEDHPCRPISNYGASKLACEAYVSSYCASYGMKGTSLRLANIFGERSTHGVMYDFYHKLRKDPTTLEILGDGKQDKSYLHVSDCVSAFMVAWEKQEKQYDVFNVGSNKKTDVATLAKLQSKAMGREPEFTFTGSKRGWTGDVTLMLLDTSKISSLGWAEKITFEEGLKRYMDSLSA